MKPYLKNAIWAGNRLISEFGKGGTSSLAESWELSDYPGAESVANSGELFGKTFSELHNAFAPGRETILTKFIDSSEDLSIQVHPSVSVGEVKSKNECWYVVNAEPGAKIAYGLKSAYDSTILRKAALDGTLSRYLNFIEVKAGDFFYVPAGLIHAIGAGITIVEIQETSDTTYRLFDYGRLDSFGKPRELHLDEALSVFKHFDKEEINRLRFLNVVDATKKGCLLACPYFSVFQIEGLINTKEYTEIEAVVIFLESGKINCGDCEFTVRKGETYYIPPETECEIQSSRAILATF